MKTLIDALNANDFKAFPQANNPGKVTVSVAGKAGDVNAAGQLNRYFLTRVACGINEDGSAQWMWAKGAQWKPQGAPAAAAPVAPVATEEVVPEF